MGCWWMAILMLHYSISEHPLPMRSTRPGARMAGREMSNGAYGFGSAGQDLLKEVSYFQPDDCLEETCSIVAAGEISMLQHLLGNFSIKLGGEVA
ncbi:hypothetical protein SADUNF_Sadunf01G0108700 [Salix dunnii]|uniref:GAGA-binding transcriptional activator n=1 Tax=Salix dunnii TaxID=1413687 RepID=A0A835TJZ6_9ROSI|nr:hypothetical protein SADUNF_Sadunf01G0108700 [Salix dunnii]